MRRSRSGPAGPLDEQSFAAAFEAHFADVWRFAFRRCASAADADDVAAEAFAVAWRRRVDLPAEPELRLWLFGAARLVLANHARSAQRHERLQRRLAEAAPAASAAGPDDAVAPALAAALETLASADREVLLLHAWEQLQVREIAQVLSCSPNAVSLRLHRARRRLQRALDRERSATRVRAEVRPQGEAS